MTTDQVAAPSVPSSEGTAEFYDVFNLLLIDVWDENFHQGYWEDENDESSNRRAAERMTQLLIDHSGLENGGRVLDVGCGIGLSAFQLAGATPAEIVGISNNQAQIDEANRRSRAQGLADRVTFEYADVYDLPYPEGSFDVVWVFDALLHMDRLRTLRELRRVLRPGGRVVVTDKLQTGPMSPEDERAVSEFMTDLQASPILWENEYRALVAEADLEVAELLDISKHTYKSSTRTIEAVNAKYDALIDRYGEQVIPMLELLRNPVGLVKELGYLLCVAKKPA
ncbi:methyltransferase domain-containing protein [Sphaerisporangium siamense]|nr:methyltransferase domain-containing protein [Sphaerisporangium siamense]MBB4702442.1 ubiquinone/menaquinone biosynthesis C-methylase UbiE [Sphaerisporangium siamense]